jgi:hypothetical protein
MAPGSLPGAAPSFAVLAAPAAAVEEGAVYSVRDIPPERIRGVITFAALACSPVKDDVA